MEKTQPNTAEDIQTAHASPKGLIIAGYLFALLGGLIGFFIGQYLNGYQKTLPNGQVVLVHSDNVRKHGRYIMTLGAVVLLVVCFLKLTNRL